jgi:hypothetical protein
MGKNPNAKKQKAKKFKEREYTHNVEDLEEEAARRGCEVWELDEVRKEQEEIEKEEEDGDNEK